MRTSIPDQPAHIGRLRYRILIQQRTDVPTGIFGMAQEHAPGEKAWADVRPVTGVTYRDGVQTGQRITHRFYIRYRAALSDADEIIYNGRKYRIERVTDWKERRRFTVIEAEELGAADGD